MGFFEEGHKSLDILKEWHQKTEEANRLLATLSAEQKPYYRVVVFCGSRFPPGSQTLKDAYEIGLFLGQNGIDAIEGGGTAGSAMYALADGHAAGVAQLLGSTKKPRRYASRMVFPWETPTPDGVRTHSFDAASLLPRAQFFGAMGTDFLVLRGGGGTEFEKWFIWQELQLHNAGVRSRSKTGDALIDGKSVEGEFTSWLSLVNPSCRLGWIPKIFSFEPEADFEPTTYVRSGFMKHTLINRERGDHLLMVAQHKMDALKRSLEARHRAWRLFMQKNGIEPKN